MRSSFGLSSINSQREEIHMCDKLSEDHPIMQTARKTQRTRAVNPEEVAHIAERLINTDPKYAEILRDRNNLGNNAKVKNEQSKEVGNLSEMRRDDTVNTGQEGSRDRRTESPESASLRIGEDTLIPHGRSSGVADAYQESTSENASALIAKKSEIPEEWMVEAATEIMEMTEEASRLLNGPRFCFEEYVRDVALIIEKHDKKRNAS